MTPQSSLLGLPFEIREMIWQYAAVTGGANGLRRTCRLVRYESFRYFKLPKDVKELKKLRILVDSSYTDGNWLKLEYTWSVDGGLFRTINVIKDMDQPLARRLKKIKEVDKATIVLEAPRRGHFFGALLMMLAKCHDAYRLIHRITKHGWWHEDRNLTIAFTTEPIKIGQSSREAKPFWECRTPKNLANELRRRVYQGPEPFYYEYFLVNSPRSFEHCRDIKFGQWPRPHVSSLSTYTGPEDNTGYSDVWLRRVPGVPEPPEPYVLGALSPRDEVARRCAESYTRVDNEDYKCPYYRTTPRLSHVRTLIFTDYTILNSCLQFHLDNIAGPPGGPLAMLRLHRLKTIEGSKENFFAHRKSRRWRSISGLEGASTEINLRMRKLFNPFAPNDIRMLRSTCHHLSQVDWSQNIYRPSKTLRKCPRKTWLQFYPDGISYPYKSLELGNSGSLVKWRFQQETVQKPRDYDSYHEKPMFCYWYDSMCCCDIAYEATWKPLSSDDEAWIMQDWDRIFDQPYHNGSSNLHCLCSECFGKDGKTVMLRRQAGMRCVQPEQFLPHTVMFCIRKQYERWNSSIFDERTFNRGSLECRYAGCEFCHEPVEREEPVEPPGVTWW